MSAHKNDGIYMLPSEVFEEIKRKRPSNPQRICLYNKKEFTCKSNTDGNIVLEISEDGNIIWTRTCKEEYETREEVLMHVIADFPEIAKDL